jgi:diguanylate cyclase (GGDEF)-like protein
MIFSSLNKLKVRIKLFLLFILPAISLIYLGYAQISSEKILINKSEHLINAIQLTNLLSSIIHELQIERGYTSEILDPSQQTPKNLLQQYNKTDKSIQLFFQFENENNSKYLTNMELESIVYNLQQIELVRRRVVKKLDTFENYFNKYTNQIHSILNIIQSLKGFSTDSNSLQQISSYIKLLQIQEYAGQERAYLNKVFLKGQMDVESYKKIIAFVSQQSILLELFYHDGDKHFTTLLKKRLNTNNTKELLLLRNAGLEKAKKDYLLNKIQNIIGYGGLIHDFKDFVIRDNPKYKDRFKKDLNQVIKIIDEYNNLQGMSKNESRYLAVILKTLNSYSSMLPIVETMRLKGKTIKEIDAVVKVNNGPARTAIGLLNNYVTGLDSSSWLLIATTRINTIHSVAQDIEKSISYHAATNYEKESLSLVLHIIFISMVLILLTLLSFLLIRRIIFEVGNITHKIEVMRSNENFDHILDTNGNDEIALMAKAFNSLIIQQRSYQKKLLKQANYDDLTGLANRKRCSEKIAEEIDRSSRTQAVFSVLFLDLDRFKIINDSLGHHIGDDLLRQVGNRLKTTIRHTDLLTRIGGDEFVIILTEIKTIQNVKNIANNILNILNENFLLEKDHQAIISASIGIAMYPEDGDSVDSLLKNADTAMYQAKDKGKNQYQFFTAAMNNKVMNYMRIEQELHIALEYQQFELYYQPIFDLQTKKIASVEALIRWNSPENGLIFPDDFIPIAEETGMIVPMGKWIMQEAMHQIKDWNNRFTQRIKMGINISSRQFCDRSIPIYQVLQESLDKTGVEPSLIEFEITENLLMENSSELEETLNKISSLGIKIFMDDFGTGYSSLSYLKKFPIDVLKIDRSFVWNMDKDESDERLVRSIINMAKTMKINVLAEGVETMQHQKLLQQMGCDYAQGYLYSKPIPAKELEDLFLKKS